MTEEQADKTVRGPWQVTLAQFFRRPVGKFVAAPLLVLSILSFSIFSFFYFKYARLLDGKLQTGPFANTSNIFAGPRTLVVGDRILQAEIIAELRRSGYSETRGSAIGWYAQRPDAVEIFPGKDSYFGQEPGAIEFSGGKISAILSLKDKKPRTHYQLEPQLITNISEHTREKRRLVRFADIPKVLIHAVVSTEDKRFFQHTGFDVFRILKAAYVDLKEGRKEQGASTLTMQLARSLWLDPGKNWTRKAAEMMMTIRMEEKLSKQEIFEHYSNQIYLGRRGTFSIHGFGEGARVYFGKDIRRLTLPEAATLAGLVQRPSYYNPFRYPSRLIERRNIVLLLMRQNGYIGEQEYTSACASPLNVDSGSVRTAESTEAPYFVDLVNEELQTRFQGQDYQSGSNRVYTTVDLNLQRAADEAVRTGIRNVDELLRKKRRKNSKSKPAEPQVALVAMDPHTGQIKALSGGRDYVASQLNRVLAKRQPGSVFKPFVYAAALNTGVGGGRRLFTPATMLQDEPTTFWFNSRPYEPNNFKQAFYGDVTLRRALAKSMNIATVQLAEMVGYKAVVNLARACGLNESIQPTPAVALGAYEAAPLEMAGAYTVFANQGVYVRPNLISAIRDENGSVTYVHKPETRAVLDPRVTYLMVNLMEEVMRSGTAAGARSRGFRVPAAGKTGTSRDGWFAGFTTQLLCIVWVGFDDNSDLDLEGGKAALPIWTEFMKSALALSAYRDAKPFQRPQGVVSVEIDPESGELATALCPDSRPESFISGTQPREECLLHNGEQPAYTSGGFTVSPTAMSHAAGSDR